MSGVASPVAYAVRHGVSSPVSGVFQLEDISTRQIPTAFFNGLNASGSTYTGGPTYVPDNLGVLRSAGANLIGVEGARLATTLADGAVLGPELVVNGSFDSDTTWQKEAGWSINVALGVAVAVAGTDSSLYQELPTAQYDKCIVAITANVTAGSVTVRFGDNTGQRAISTTGTHTIEITDNYNGYLKLFKSAAFSGSISLVSVKKVIPTYVSTDLSGAPIVASRPQRTRVNVETTALGPELVTVAADRDFSSDTGFWNKETGSSISGGKVVFTNVGLNLGIYKPAFCTVGKIYAVSYDLTITSGSVSSWAGNNTAAFLPARTSNGTYTDLITCTTTTFIEIGSKTAGTNATIDNVSIKEVIPVFSSNYLPSTTFPRFDISDPLRMPGLLCEPARTNYALNSATPATHTTGSLSAGTYTLWQEGTGSIVATAGTAVGTFGTASNGTPVTITITTAGTVVLTASGTNTWVQLELGAFKTSRIYTTIATATRAGTVLTYPTAGKIRSNNMAMRKLIIPKATGQSGVYAYGTYLDANNYTALLMSPTSITLRKRAAGVDTDATVNVTHTSGVPLDIIGIRSATFGMKIAVRSYSAGTWSAWTDGAAVTTAAAKANAIIGTTYQLGALNSVAQFTGNISLFDTLLLPDNLTDPLAYAKSKWRLPA